jgi:hypothetical protein
LPRKSALLYLPKSTEHAWMALRESLAPFARAFNFFAFFVSFTCRSGNRRQLDGIAAGEMRAPGE